MVIKIFSLVAAASFAIAILFFLNTQGVDAQAVKFTANVQPSSTLTLLIEKSYRWYANVDALDPVTSLAAEGASVATPIPGTNVRLRMNVGNIGGVTLPSGATFILQYANSASGPWSDVASGTPWAFNNNPSVPDGQIISTLLLGSSTVGESYGQSNPSAATPAQLVTNSFGEWDWSLRNFSATTSQNWFFRMINSSGTILDGYNLLPQFTATTTPPAGGGPGGGESPGGGGAIQVGSGVSTGYVSSSASSTSSASPFASSTTPLPEEVALRYVDFNFDRKVNLVDLSILLYYYGRNDRIALKYDISGNHRIGLADVSILMYYWTG